MADTVNSFPITESYILRYTANVQAALFRAPGLLYPFVSKGMYSGERSQIVNFLGPLYFTKRTAINADTKAVEPEHTSRWIAADDYDCAVLVDRVDTLRTIYDPTNPYVDRMREALGRLQDDVIMAAFFADARTGKTGTGTASFATVASDTIAAGGVGLTFAKLRSLRKTMKRRFLDLRVVKPIIGVTAQQTDDLLGETVVGSHDYNAVKPLADGEVSTFMGFQFLPLEGVIPAPTANVRDLPVWVPDGMHFGDWQSMQIIIGPRADKNNITQVHASTSFGSTRVEEGRVFKCQVVDTNAT